MANEETKPKYLEDLTRYNYANVAHRLLSNKEDAPFARGALEKLVGGFGVDKDILEGLKAGTFASKEGIQTAIQIYAGKYEKALGSLSIPEFYDVRYGSLKSILGDEDANKAKAVFEKYKDQTVGSITKKFRQANAKLEDDTELFDEKAKEEAEKTMKKLAPIYQLIQLLEKRNYEELRNGAMKDTYKQMINESLKEA
ncbi:MAG: hypothetical protein PHQ66_02280 [Candidatus Nanoarchaeia archaeon]|nr:hypothetical protein [Candidatus Nanoarchaeia archaeon]MDD5357803.1 hypothetical protein [Candidatus Nanoarchaeia archaeon]MDD5588722.1 hypothetical protein [Candidatus Nanoarchaeia archaeon]